MITHFRSFYLSLEIKKVLRNASLPSQNQVISLICPNGASYVIGQWAVWMSGNIMVPLSGQHSPKALEYFIRDSQSSIVISANCFMDQVEDVAVKLDKPLICLDTNNPWQTHTVDFSEDSVYEGLIFNENVYPKDRPVMMLYLPGNFSTENFSLENISFHVEVHYRSTKNRLLIHIFRKEYFLVEKVCSAF